LQKALVIGSGFAGMSAACFMARGGFDVKVLEKHSTPGGRARSFNDNGFSFDMGPSWYWMPDVFQRFFAEFDKSPADYYDLVRLDPSYQIFFEDETVHIPADFQALKALFEQYETGAGRRLEQFLKEAAYKYKAAFDSLIYKPGLSPLEFLRWDVASSAFKIDIFQSMATHVRKYFSHPKLLQLMEFPILFLGALPSNTPALYSLMNYADIKLGTWYPMGGMVKIADAMYQLGEQLGVEFIFNETVTGIAGEKTKANSVTATGGQYTADVIVAACDYHHADQALLTAGHKNYDQKYWNSRKMAPSCLLFYVGLNKKLAALEHHNLFFDAPFEKHAGDLYADPKWPADPLMYVCCPSKTDVSVAPAGCENLFVLIPIAPGLEDTEEIRQKYFSIATQRLKQKTGEDITGNIISFRSYAGSDFAVDYNAFKGNAYGLSNTLMQTAFLKPSIRNKKLSNLFYTGQLTVPGPGVPPALISGEIVAKQAIKQLKPLKNDQYDIALS
jgi:phytoene desaturase